MKKLITLIAISLCFITTQAQLTLEHTYTGFASTNGTYYMSSTSNNIKLYNASHSVFKTVNLYPSIGDQISVISWGTTQLFNTDSKMEFLVAFIGTSNKIVLINEDGAVLQEFPGSTSAYPYNINGQGKLLVYYYNASTTAYTTKIYTLSGAVPIAKPALANSGTLGQSYPNPATEATIIPYSINPGTTTTMEIYNATGTLMEQLTIDSTFDNIHLNTSNYPAGTYFYRIGNLTKSFIVL